MLYITEIFIILTINMSIIGVYISYITAWIQFLI